MSRLLLETARLTLWLFVAALSAAGVATAQTYPPSACELELSRSILEPGEEFVVVAHGFAPGAELTFVLEREGFARVLAVVTADDRGRVRAEPIIPAGARPGRYTLHVRGGREGGGVCRPEAVLLVEGAGVAAARGGENLASTGFPAAKAAVLGAALLALGVALRAASRRRIRRRG
jgi:hypothetical protein